MDKQQILELIENQRNYLPNSAFKDLNNRIETLKLLKKNIVLIEQQIAEALKKDLNKSMEESYMSEIGLVLSELSYMIRHCKRFSKPKKVWTPLAQFHSSSYKMPCPYGSVLIISPWNYPFMLSIEPLIDAVAAGNCVVLKPSKSTPNVSAVIDKLIRMTFKPEQAFVVLGGREDCDFLLDQEFDYIFFTGSSRVGKEVLKKASEHFTPVTLELGGKCPCIVDETADIELSAKRIVFGKFLNCGQTCVAPDYVYCARSVKQRLIKEIERQIVLQYTVDPIRNKNYPKMVNERQFDNVLKFINKEKLLFGGKSNRNLLKIEPTLLEASFEDDCMQEEIFGPILPIVTFDYVGEAVKKLQHLPKPLALYVFTKSKENKNLVLNSCDFGGGCVNDTVVHIATSNMGFGGLKQSGLGSYHGKAGFDAFSHYKSIVDKKNWIDLPIRYQPHNKFKYKLMRWFMK